MLHPDHNNLHAMQTICTLFLKRVIDFGILCVIEWRGRFLPQQINQEFDVHHLRVTIGRTSKRQAIAVSLRALSSVLGTSPAGCPIRAPFGYEHNDWNTQTNIRVGGASP